MKRIISLLLALVLCFGAIPFFGIEASAATSSAVANAVSNRLPLLTYAMPLSGASKVYSFTNDTFSDKTTSYYIDSFKDQIVITQISTDGRAVCVSYPSSSSSTGYRSRWFATDDILGLATVDIRPYTCSSGNTTYRMSSASAVTSYGSISKNDSCVMLGNHTVGGKIYYPTIYPISSGTYNKVSGVRNKLALGQYAPSNAMRDVTASFANKTITIKSVENGKYLCADSNASGTPLRANKDQAITWETFTVSPLTADGWVGFKAHNGKWLSAMADTTNTPIGAKYDNLYSWECFRIFQKGNDYFIRAQINDKWLCVRVDTDQAPVQAYASVASTWERLSIRIVMDDTQKSIQSRLDEIASGTRTYENDNIKTVMKVGSKFTGFRSGEQCKGYAKNVFYICFKIQPGSTQSNNYLLNTTTGMTEVGRVTNQDTQSLANLFANARPGDFVQMRRTHGGPHSAIVYSVTNDGITFLEANVNGPNLIEMNLYTWADLATKNNAMTLYTATTYALK